MTAHFQNFWGWGGGEGGEPHRRFVLKASQFVSLNTQEWGGEKGWL